MMRSGMTLQKLHQMGQGRYQLIDIRTPAEFSSGHAKGAINIPYDLLIMYPETYLKKDGNYYLICSHGSLSHRASHILKSYGYQVNSIENGYELRYCYC